MDSRDGTVSVETAAEGYLRLLDHLGVDLFINSPGSDDSPFWEALAKLDGEASEDGTESSIAHLNCRHEALAVSIAKGYALSTGSPQVVKLHVNTGPLHAAMELAGAYHSAIPLVVLSSYDATHEGEMPGGTSGPHYLSFQQLGGHENNVHRYMKWIASLDTNANGEKVIARAYRIAASWPPGPVFVNIAEELLFDTGVGSVTLPALEPVGAPGLDDEAAASIVRKLASAENPMIITGRLGPDRSAVEDLQTVAETLDVPVFENEKRQYTFPMDHPLYLGASAGLAATPDPYFETDLDLVLVIGSTKPWYPPEGGAPDDAEIVMLNPEPVQERYHYWNYPADRLHACDPGEALRTIASKLEGVRRSGARTLRRDRRRWEEKAAEGAGRRPIDPFWLCQQLDESLPDDAIIVNETIVHRSIVGNVIEDADDRRYLSATKSNGGGLGSGLGTAVGAKLAEPDRLAAVLVGDGSFSYNPVAASFGAAQEHALPLFVVIFNNRGYRSMRRNLERDYPEGWAAERETYYGSAIDPMPDHARLVEAWGGYGEKVETPEAIPDAVSRGLAAVDDGRSVVLDVLLEEAPPEYPAQA